MPANCNHGLTAERKKKTAIPKYGLRPELVERRAAKAAEVLINAGFAAYIVGGAVRSLLMSMPVEDWDIATSAPPKATMALFERSYPTGLRHGTVTVIVDELPIEVTTFRREGDYRDGRRPSSVEFVGNIEEDLSRRDFTINAIAYDPVHDVLADPFGGVEDIGKGLIRAVGEPEARFREDYLRILRAVRFAAVLGFEIEPGTFSAIAKVKEGLSLISRERIRDELTKMLVSPHPMRGLLLMEEADLLDEVLPEMRGWGVGKGFFAKLCCEQPSGIATCLEKTSPSPASRWAVLIGIIEFVTGRAVEIEEVRMLLSRLRYDGATIRRVKMLLGAIRSLPSPDATDGDVRRFVGSIGAENVPHLMELLQNYPAFGPGGREIGRRLEKVLNGPRIFTLRDLKITGREVSEILGISPGPRIGAILGRLLEAAQEDPELNAKKRLREYLKGHADSLREV